MIKSREKLETYDGLVFCFIASVIIAIVAYNIGIVTEPGKILPVGISMRNGDMGENIIRGIDLAMEDLELIRELGKGRVDVTVGSALSIFGGTMDWKEVLEVCD